MTSDARTTFTPSQGTPLPAMMRAVRVLTANAADGIEIQEIPVPQPGPGEVLVRVYAAAITRDELEWVTDRLPATPSYEFSGVVASVGATVSDWMVGQDVFALSSFDRDGAAAEYVLVRGDQLASKPHALGYIEAAAVPLAALSAWQGLFDHGELVRGERSSRPVPNPEDATLPRESPMAFCPPPQYILASVALYTQCYEQASG